MEWAERVWHGSSIPGIIKSFGIKRSAFYVAGVAWVGIISCTARLLGQFLVWVYAQVAAQSPEGGGQEAADPCYALTSMVPFLFPSPFLSLQKLINYSKKKRKGVSVGRPRRSQQLQGSAEWVVKE